MSGKHEKPGTKRSTTWSTQDMRNALFIYFYFFTTSLFGPVKASVDVEISNIVLSQEPRVKLVSSPRTLN